MKKLIVSIVAVVFIGFLVIVGLKFFDPHFSYPNVHWSGTNILSSTVIGFVLMATLLAILLTSGFLIVRALIPKEKVVKPIQQQSGEKPATTEKDKDKDGKAPVGKVTTFIWNCVGVFILIGGLAFLLSIATAVVTKIKEKPTAQQAETDKSSSTDQPPVKVFTLNSGPIPLGKHEFEAVADSWTFPAEIPKGALFSSKYNGDVFIRVTRWKGKGRDYEDGPSKNLDVGLDVRTIQFKSRNKNLKPVKVTLVVR